MLWRYSGLTGIMTLPNISEADLTVWGRVNGLPDIPHDFMPELRTIRDPVTCNDLRFAAHRFGDWEVSRCAVWQTREHMEDNVPPDGARIDGSIRALIWYAGAALQVAEPNVEVKEFLAEADPHRIGSVYPANWFGGSPVNPEKIRTIDDLMAWAQFETGTLAIETAHPDHIAGYPPTLSFHRQIIVCGNGEESAAIAQLCWECALMVAGFRTAHTGGMWRIPPETDIRIDMFGRKCVSFYARVAARSMEHPNG